MNKTFWIRLAVLMAIVTALGFYRVSENKIKEQNIIAELQLHQSAASIAFFQWITNWATLFNLGIPGLFLVFGLIRKKKMLIRHALIVLLGMGLGGLLSRGIKVTVKEPRPYEVDTRIAKLSPGTNHSFPSGHTVEVTASAIGVSTLLIRTPVAMIISATWAILIMYSRIVLGVHNFTDILGGIAIALMGLLIVNYLFERFSIKNP